ncbi:Calx-beta domain-containing protein [Chloroflexus aurantiacus]
MLGTPTSTTSTITDDDAPPNLAWQRRRFRAAEGAGSGLVTLLLPAPSRYTVTVQCTTSDGTATAGSAYTATSGYLTISARYRRHLHRAAPRLCRRECADRRCFSHR